MMDIRLTQERIKKYLSEGKRFDKRDLLQFRNIEIETGISNKAEGSARVKLGNTEVIVGIKMGISEPYPDSPDEGTLMVSCELTPLSSPKYEPGPPKFNSVELARLIDRGIREGFIDFKKLCIKAGEKVWSVFVDIYSINDDGNLVDAASFATIAALKSARIPVYDEATEKINYGELSGNPLPLNEKLTPINLTFYKIGGKIILDPIELEEEALESKINIAMSEVNGEVYINSIQKGEAGEFSMEDMKNILDLAKETFKNQGEQIIKKITEAVKKGEKKK